MTAWKCVHLLGPQRQIETGRHWSCFVEIISAGVKICLSLVRKDGRSLGRKDYAGLDLAAPAVREAHVSRHNGDTIGGPFLTSYCHI